MFSLILWVLAIYKALKAYELIWAESVLAIGLLIGSQLVFR
jgi:hypothetical protein